MTEPWLEQKHFLLGCTRSSNEEKEEKNQLISDVLLMKRKRREEKRRRKRVHSTRPKQLSWDLDVEAERLEKLLQEEWQNSSSFQRLTKCVVQPVFLNETSTRKTAFAPMKRPLCWQEKRAVITSKFGK